MLLFHHPVTPQTVLSQVNTPEKGFLTQSALSEKYTNTDFNWLITAMYLNIAEKKYCEVLWRRSVSAINNLINSLVSQFFHINLDSYGLNRFEKLSQNKTLCYFYSQSSFQMKCLISTVSPHCIYSHVFLILAHPLLTTRLQFWS